MFSFLTDVWEIDYSNKFVNWFYSEEFVFGIAKYAVCILTGIILAYFICTIEGERMKIKKDQVLAAATIIVPLCILGARLWYLIGDGYDSYAYYYAYEGQNFFKAILDLCGMFIGFRPEANWTYGGLAGLAIHGGITVAIIGAFIASRHFKWNFGSVCDMTAPGLLIGQIAGRWGNFFNKEAHGTIVGGWTEETVNGITHLIPNVDSLEAQYEILTKQLLVPSFIAKNMLMPASERYYYGIVDGVQTYGTISGAYSKYFFYPTFLWESLLNLLGLGLYFILRRQKWVKSGAFGPLYLIWYGVVRYFIEILRTDSLYIPGTTLKMAQLTSIIMIVAGVLILIYLRFIKKGPNYTEVIKMAEEERLKKEEAK